MKVFWIALVVVGLLLIVAGAWAVTFPIMIAGSLPPDVFLHDTYVVVSPLPSMSVNGDELRVWSKILGIPLIILGVALILVSKPLSRYFWKVFGRDN